MKKILSIAALTISIMACANQQPKSMSLEQCKNSKICTVTGDIKIKGDKGFIGEIIMENGKCVNVSLPDAASRSLVDAPPKKMTVTGRVMPYPDYEEIADFSVNNRKIGFGWCDNFYIFVSE